MRSLFLPSRCGPSTGRFDLANSAHNGLPAPRNEWRIEEPPVFFSVQERPAVGCQNASAYCIEKGMAAGSVPLVGPPEAGINIRLAPCDHAELERRAQKDPLRVPEFLEEVFS